MRRALIVATIAALATPGIALVPRVDAARTRRACYSEAPRSLAVPLELLVQSHPGKPVLDAVESRAATFLRMAGRFPGRLAEIHAQVGSDDLRRQLQEIRLSVGNTHNGLGTAIGNRVEIDEAYFRIAMTRSYSEGIFDSIVRVNRDEATRLFEVWNDLFVDGVIAEDPPFQFDGGAECSTAHLKQNRWPPDYGKRAAAWMGFVVFHEVGHIVLRHEERFDERFARIPSDVAHWPAAALAFSRSGELEADKFAVDSLRILGLDVKMLFPGIGLWWIARQHWNATSAYSTHPAPIERVAAMLDRLSERGSIGRLKEDTLAMLERLRERLARGPLQPLPDLLVTPRDWITPSVKRTLTRQAVLTTMIRKTFNANCLFDLAPPQAR